MKFSFLYGSDLPTLVRLFRQEKFRIRAAAIPYLPFYIFLGIINSLLGLPEKLRVSKASPVKPVFILGHWRSGTSHLHNLMTADQSYAAPNVFQVAFPHLFIYSEKWLAPIMDLINPGVRPMDAMEMHMSTAYEEEVALAALGAPTPYLAIHFPKDYKKYQAFLSFQHASEKNLETWKRKYRAYLRKLTAKYGQEKSLILKSPGNTARIPLLLDMYPDARFIHIHRNPYETIRSSMHLYDVWFEMFSFQSLEDFKSKRDTEILEVYEELYNHWFRDQHLIPSDNLMTVSFKKLKKEPVKAIEEIYHFLGDVPLDIPKLEKYLASISSYRQNSYNPLSSEMIIKINQRMAFVFNELDYPMREP